MKILRQKNLDIQKIMTIITSKRSKKNDVTNNVKNIINNVRQFRDKALFDLTLKFDKIELSSLKVTNNEIKEAKQNIDNDLVTALKIAKKNIELFHKKQLTTKKEIIETSKDIITWREFRPIEKVGLYIPGGKASYPSTVLMLGIPAKIAGCKEIVVCTPANKDGKCNDAILVACDLLDIRDIYKIGGAQAVAALTYGTETIPKVYKIFGPGNQYVTTAKMMCFGEIDIDMPAGPSELAILADLSAKPNFIAADLLSQMEHGEDSQCLLVSSSEKLAQNVIVEIQKQLSTLPRKNIITKSIENSFVIVMKSIHDGIKFMNQYAPEHLEIITNDDEYVLDKIINAGSVFLGNYTPTALGDYASGTNHTLPTSGFAKMFQALSVESFGKKMQIQKASKSGLSKISETVETLAGFEGFEGHKQAVKIRNYKS